MPFAPSDRLPEPPFSVAGRVVDAREGSFTLADAFGSIDVLGDAKVGSLVVASVIGRENSGFRAQVEVVGAGHEGPETVRLRTRAAFLERRATLLAAVRSFFGGRGYLEVETPIAVPSPGLDVHLDAVPAGERFLITSPEYQMKRLLVGGLPRIFQIVRCFRQGEVGARHNPEFSMLEWYRAFSAIDSMIEETEALIVHVATAARGRAELVAGGRTIALSPPFERLPIATAFARHAAIAEDRALALSTEDEERFFRIMVEEIEPALAEGPPVVLVEWPASQASLARKKPGDPRVAERFEIVIGGVELCNGFGELVDPNEQRARFLADQAERRQRGLPVYPIDERFVAALEEGMPPSSGNALGLDRLIALCLGAKTIGDVLAFPEGFL
ncbi:MAG: EF-P lysine aminoacylase EpmA [Polyangiales bacterium]